MRHYPASRALTDLCPVCGGEVIVHLDNDGDNEWPTGFDRQCGCPIKLDREGLIEVER